MALFDIVSVTWVFIELCCWSSAQVIQPFSPNNFNTFLYNSNNNFNSDNKVRDNLYDNNGRGNMSEAGTVYFYHKLHTAFKIHHNTSTIRYMIVAPGLIQPSSVYSAAVTFMEGQSNDLDLEQQKMDVRLSLFKNGADIQGTTKIMTAGSTETLNILVPKTLTRGLYKIRVEGNYLNSQGGTLFAAESVLKYSEKFLSILIQTNRFVFTGGQKVLFRVIMLKRDLLPYGDSVDVFMLDSRGLIMRRWPSVASNVGVVDLDYELPEYSNIGDWKIKVQAGSQIEEKKIRVEKYFQPQYEVYVSMTPFILSTEESITASISSFYGSEKTGKGNCTVRLYGTFYGKNPRYKGYKLIGVQSVYLLGEEEVTWDMAEIFETMGDTNNIAVRVEADFTEYFIGETRLGFAESRIVKQSIQLKFIQNAPLAFKPGLPFKAYVVVSYEDQEKVPPEILQESTLRVLPIVQLESGGRIELPFVEVSPLHFKTRQESLENLIDANDEKIDMVDFMFQSQRVEKYVETNILEVKLVVPKKASRLILRADYSDSAETRISTTATAYAYYSPSSKFISVEKSGSYTSVGEYAILHVRTNFPMESFHYLVVAKGLITQVGTEVMSNTWSTPRSFSVTVAPEMAPGFRVLVYHATQKGEIVSDSVFVPVDQISRHSIDLEVNQNKDRLKDTVEFRYVGDPASYFGSSAQRSVREFMQAGNELNKAGVLKALHSLEPWNKSLHKLEWRNRNGEAPDTVQYFPSMNYGLDSYRTFAYSSLIMFSDGDVPSSPRFQECPEERCITESCFSFSEKCDGVRNCEDGTDEFNCNNLDDDLTDFRVMRISRYMDFYDPSDGDWAWHHENIAHGGDYILMKDVPKITDTWHINGFGMSKKNGFSILESSIVYETNRPFMMLLDAPPSLRRGEQVGVIAMLYNKTPMEMFIMVTLHDSPDYVFVHVGKEGLFDFTDGSPRFSSGDHQHFVWMPPESETELRIPVRPTIDQGTVEVTITATTQIRADTSSVEIEVLPEGAAVGKHTSMLLDLRNRAVILRFMDVFVEDTPEIPYEIKRKYIFGSPAGHVLVSGDIMGPIVSLLPVSMGNLIGKDGKGTADRLFDLSANVWTMHYLRLTNQVEKSKSRITFEAMNKLFAQIMKRFNPLGWFKMWNISRASVWLSSWALQVFSHGSFQDWEDHFYIERRIFSRVTRWLLKYQQADGSFSETPWYNHRQLNKKMGQRNNTSGVQNATLTAHLIITLHHVVPNLDGSLRVEASIAKSKALHFLETRLVQMSDPYQIAICAYALTLGDSPQKELVFTMLHSHRREESGFVYWSPGDVVTNNVIYENNRPFVQAKNNEFWDSVAVEASSYALLVYLTRDGITPITEKILTWLNTMKLTDGAFIASLDTAITFQALTEYANRARIRDITDMSVSLDLSGSPDEAPDRIFFSPDNVSESVSMDLENVWGHVNVVARGAGQAVIQLDLSYGVDWEEYKDTPPEDAFELTIRQYFSHERNKSVLITQSCFRWILLEESDVSGAAVLEVEIPSGYGLIQSDAIALVSSLVHPTLKDSISAHGKTSWFFEYIPAYWTCFNHTVRRWHPVANLTTHRQATLYEAYAPERFVNTVYNDTSLQMLDICQVCGSYQCPYCPFYNTAPSIQTIQLPIFILAMTFHQFLAFQ